MSKLNTWAIIGGGNGGQSLAGHLAIQGFPVRLYDIFPETIEAIQELGGIHVDGAVNGFGPLEQATNQIADAVKDADIVMIVTPAIAHRSIARECAPYLKDGQIVFIHPGSTGGALEFKQELQKLGCTTAVTLAESNSLLYACRCSEPGRASIFGVKKELTVAALPAEDNQLVMDKVKPAFPQMKPGRHVLETSLGNPNAIMHPAPTLLNASLIESDRNWLYYYDGITPSIGAFVEALDLERIAIGRAFGLDLPPIRSWYKLAYGVSGNSLCDVVRANAAYASVKGQTQLQTRYLLEDIPMGLLPMVSIGKALGIEVVRMENVINLAQFLLGEDLCARGRTIEALGLAGKTIEEILEFVNTGG